MNNIVSPGEYIGDEFNEMSNEVEWYNIHKIIYVEDAGNMWHIYTYHYILDKDEKQEKTIYKHGYIPKNKSHLIWHTYYTPDQKVGDDILTIPNKFKIKFEEIDGAEVLKLILNYNAMLKDLGNDEVKE